MPDSWSGPLEKIDDYRWRIPKSYRMDMRLKLRPVGVVKG